MACAVGIQIFATKLLDSPSKFRVYTLIYETGKLQNLPSGLMNAIEIINKGLQLTMVCVKEVRLALKWPKGGDGVVPVAVTSGIRFEKHG